MLGREAQSVRHHGFRGLRDGLEDIMYLWAVAEAYVQDADMQNSMRWEALSACRLTVNGAVLHQCRQHGSCSNLPLLKPD